MVLKGFPCFPRKQFQLRHSKIGKTEKCNFQRFRTFVFDLKVASKPFSKMLPITNFRFKRVCFAFPDNCFNFVTQKLAKNGKLIESRISDRNYFRI